MELKLSSTFGALVILVFASACTSKKKVLFEKGVAYNLETEKYTNAGVDTGVYQLIPYEAELKRYQLQIESLKVEKGEGVYRAVYPDTTRIWRTENLWIDNGKVKSLRTYQDVYGNSWKFKKTKEADRIFYQNRFYDRQIIIANEKEGVVKIIDRTVDEEYMIYDSIVTTITKKAKLDSFENPVNKATINNVVVQDQSKCINQLPYDQILNEDNKRFVVIYSYIGCPPCAKLKKELMGFAEKGELLTSEVKIVNPKDSKEAITKYKVRYNIPFAYIQPRQQCSDGAFPIIAGYSPEGKLIWQETGYTSKTAKEVKRFLAANR